VEEVLASDIITDHTTIKVPIHHHQNITDHTTIKV
jgi:hypothetical protein